MSIFHLNAVRAVASIAKQIGATLPADIAAALDHLDTVTAAQQPTSPRPGAIAAELAQHLGNPAAMEKARKAAASQLATGEADGKISAHLAEACGSRLRMLMRRDAERIAAAIGAALTDDLATLQADAPKLPQFFRPEDADALAPAVFAGWHRARGAYARIAATQPALGILYAGAVADEDERLFPAPAAAVLRIAKPPALDTADAAHAFTHALAGRAVKGQGTAEQGAPWAEGLFVPAALAHAGASFEWATPRQVAERAQLVLAGMTESVPAPDTPAAVPPVVDRGPAPAAFPEVRV